MEPNAVVPAEKLTVLNPEYVKIQEFIKEIALYRKRMRESMWQIAKVLHRIYKDQLYAKAGYMSFDHFLYSAGLNRHYMVIAALPGVMTEEEFTLIGQGKATIMVNFIRAYPESKADIFAIAQNATGVREMKSQLFKRYPVGDGYVSTLSLTGDPSQVDHIKEMLEVLQQSAQYGDRPIDVVEHLLQDPWQEILIKLNNFNKGRQL